MLLIQNPQKPKYLIEFKKACAPNEFSKQNGAFLSSCLDISQTEKPYSIITQKSKKGETFVRKK